MTIALVTPYFPDEHTIDSGIANHYLLLAQSLAAKVAIDLECEKISSYK
jgi:hypothetical protein